MIEREDFASGMRRMCNAFNRTVSEKVMDGWFEEIKEKELNLFNATIKTLIRGDKYPNLGQFWAAYNNSEIVFGVKEKDERGCSKCKDGIIYFIETIWKTGEKVNVVGFCKDCWPEKTRHTVDPNKDFQYQPGTEPWNHQSRAVVPRALIPEMLRDLHAKMEDPNTDWEKEEKIAWEQHDAAVNARTAYKGASG